jgi:hypothetical protein
VLVDSAESVLYVSLDSSVFLDFRFSWTASGLLGVSWLAALTARLNGLELRVRSSSRFGDWKPGDPVEQLFQSDRHLLANGISLSMRQVRRARSERD